MPRIFRIFLLTGGFTFVLAAAAIWIGYRQLDRTPSELLRYTEHRLYGHTRLENIFLPVLHAVRPLAERPIPVSGLPNLAKGGQGHALVPVKYSSDGHPLEARPTDPAERSAAPNLKPAGEKDIVGAIADARAGAIIEIAPGRYRIGAPIATRSAGTPEHPIIVRGAEPGTVIIEFAAAEGFQILHPYWVFENLTIRGICKDDSSCEHAFHIVGKARATVVRNNRIEDFNAHIKVNGFGGEWPDHGLIQYNTLANSRRRETLHPVTPIDIVGADGWRVADNVVSNFIKADGDRISYGVFMKGAGSFGRIERNLIICTDRDISQPGIRVGLSFGGGGTGQAYCRDRRCDKEYSGGIAANNIIAHCNDFGIDVNLSTQITIAHNTLINTSGIDVRNAPASANIYGNLLDGRIRARNDAWIDAENNLVGSLDSYLNAPDQFRLSWRRATNSILTAKDIGDDFCHRRRSSHSLAGALGEPNPCTELNQP